MPNRDEPDTQTEANDGTDELEGNDDTDVAKKNKKSVSKAERSNLVFPVSKINNLLTGKKSNDKMRIGVGSPVYITGVIEYFCKEILKGALAECGGTHKRMKAEHILRAIRKNPEINKVLAGMRFIVGDKIKGPEIADAILTAEQKNTLRARKEALAAEKAAQKAA